MLISVAILYNGSAFVLFFFTSGPLYRNIIPIATKFTTPSQFAFAHFYLDPFYMVKLIAHIPSLPKTFE